MTSSVRRLRLMLLCLLGLLATVPLINWIVNPYGVWRIAVVDRVYRVTQPQPFTNEAAERVTSAYRVRVEEPTTVLVGSSRVLLGMPIEPGGQDGFLNASLSGASLAEIAAVLRLATANPRLQRVIWGVDFYAFEEKFIGFRQPETRMRLEGDEGRLMLMRIKETLLSMQALADSRRVLSRVIGGRDKLPLPVPVPWPEQVIKENLEDPAQHGLDQADAEELKRHLADWIFNYSDYQLSDTQLSLFRTAMATLQQARIDVILFVPPLSHCELEVIEQAGQWDTFQRWKRQLVPTAPYWDFSGYEKLDRVDSFFVNVAHFKPAVGHVILRKLLGQGCEQCGKMAQIIGDAGVWADMATVDAYLTRQEEIRRASRHRNDACTKMVEEMLRSRTANVARPSAEALGR